MNDNMAGDNNIIDIRTFDPRFTQGIMYSIYESLLPGYSFSVIHDQLLDYKALQEDLSQEIKRAELEPGVWKLTIVKKEKQGCCGVCTC